MTKQRKCVPKKGDWVLFVKSDIVACDKDALKIMELANKYDREDIVIAKEPTSNNCFY